jgi:serine kinase of HPr protein (carbohydrate metabolism regulator)
VSAPAEPAELAVQASCVRWLGRGLLLRGPPGTGKSDLLARLLEAGGDLLADDLVRLAARDGRLLARPVAHPGLLELRGQGLVRLAALAEQPLDLLVDCRARAASRLPEPRPERLLGVALPRLVLACREASAVARLRLVLLAEPVGTGP